jgi:hypothetical protein
MSISMSISSSSDSSLTSMIREVSLRGWPKGRLGGAGEYSTKSDATGRFRWLDVFVWAFGGMIMPGIGGRS